ncbi:chromosome segregation protein SMC [Pacificimonas sp. WHA3]|uniref:Chromosome partition protein Smc n=1 Tax=Pacificimonas pallii TaxID=2827236 RepID=A0ABS6SDR9_9SPHN|nr:chromosome segregation protein SMC [Pacificimonas pallii]MBV7256495.1 chromosome segregation protein SMC [Pacificimonas pallii]
MKFRRLRLSGFKSFVDAAELRIEDGLTGVVGPNGCGKSNLLESLRWLMGESSAKSLRGAGMEDVIFAGTDRRPSRDVAEVQLQLDNKDRKAPAQFNESDEIDVSRHIERGLGSAYRINGRDVRQKDVQLLFADAATGAHSPALVSQGRIGAIINAKPQDRRKLLEEAAGIAGLHVRRKDAEQRLKAAETNLERLSDMLSGMETQAASLGRQARAAERYRKLSERITLAEGMLLYAKWRAAKSDADAAKEELSGLGRKLDDAIRNSARLTTLQEAAKSGLPALRTAEAEAAAALQTLSHRADVLGSELRDVERRMAETEAAIRTADADAARETDSRADAHAALDRLNTERGEIEAQLAEARDAIPDAEALVARLETESAEIDTKLSEALSAHADARAQRQAAEAAAEATTVRLGRAARTMETAEGAVAALEPVDALLAARTDAEAIRAQAEAALADIAGEIEAAERERETAEAARAQAQDAMSNARGLLSALESEASALTRQTQRHEGAAVRPLLDSVTVAKGYEAAFAAAFGRAVEADLEGDETAMRWRAPGADDDWKGDPALPNKVSTLADHVQAPDELSRRLAQIGLVDEAPSADAIAALAPGQSLVTPKGELYRWDGLMARPDESDGTADLLARRTRLREVEAELPTAHAAVAATGAAAAAARTALADLAARIADARARRMEAEAARGAAASELARLEGRIERGQAQAEAAAAALARAAADHGEAEAAARESAARLAALPGLDALAIAAEEVRRESETVRAKLAQARADHVTLLRSLSGGEARLNAIASERADWERRLQGSGAQQEALAARAAAAKAALAELAARPAEIEALRAALVDDRVNAETARQAAADRLAAAERAASVHDRDARAAADAMAELKEARGRLEAQRENHELRRVEMGRIAAEKFQSPPHILPAKLAFDEDEVSEEGAVSDALSKLQADRDRMGPVNLRAEEELSEIRAALDESNAESEDLLAAIARLRGSIGALNREGRARLLTAFEEVDKHFRSLFSGLFGGGEARLELVESDDPLQAGLEIMAQPPGKKLQSMSLLSGGEQAMTAVALIFAIFLTNPAPICVLDEVDAPLDDANIERFCDLLDRMTTLTDTRFLIVTHNAVTMSRMHRLYGVTMAERGVSQLVSVDLGGAETLLAAE